ncbi:ROK family protein [Amycolatopsis anabasis]|uniref:ROK family protein n=1 Tax=Amycolatopsis anabasis TaxID=1840409 RepID=UPI00131D8BE9|nr:ROK family protein [Amycolatopsis anabasis]
MNAQLVAALDVGGTSIKAALLDDELRQLTAVREPTAHGADGTALADQITRLVTGLTGGAAPAAVGVVVPGIVDEAAGVARYAANLGWRDVPFGAMLAERLGVPVAFGHDVSAGGLAEYRLGAARGFGNAVFMPVGTGIAAALLFDGKPYRAGGHAGEVGHMDVGHERKCSCGAVGCLEAIASAAALARRYGERTRNPVTGGEQVVDAARRGDPDAAAVLKEALDGLGRALTALTMVLAPDVFVLGGGLFGSGAFLLDPLRHWLSAHLTFQRMPELRLAELGDEAGCLGAGLLARALLP